MAASETRVAEAEQSFELLYRTHRRDVYNFVLHDVRNPDDAEDVTQVAFLNAYRALRSGRPPDKPRAWLLTIAQNVCRRRFRKRAANIHEVPLDAELAVAAPDDYDGPTAEEIHAAFRELPRNQRLALAMREIQGRSYAEIATELKLSIPAVETLIFRARRSLRTLLEPEENRLRGVLLFPLALPGLIGKALGSAVTSIGRAGLVGRVAGVVGAIVVGAGVVELVPPLLGAEEPPAVEEVVPSRDFAAPIIAVEPKPAAAHAAGTAHEKAGSAPSGAAGPANGASGAAGPANGVSPPAALPDVPEVPLPTAPDMSVPLELPAAPTVEVPSVEVPSVEVPSVEVPQVTLPPAPPLPDLD
jgi:RNA polymerase sigma factor (sigma-70 family)